MAVNSFNAQNPPLTTKGDLFTFSTIPTRLAVGTNGQYLSADSTAATGLKWGSVSTDKSYTLLNSGGTSLTGAATITVSGITQDDIFVFVTGASSANASANIAIRINTDTGNNYYSYGGIVTGTVNTYVIDRTNVYSIPNSYATIGKMSGDAASTVTGTVNIRGAKSTGIKPFQILGGANRMTSSEQEGWFYGGYYNASAAVTSISIFSSTGNFDAGTVYVYVA